MLIAHSKRIKLQFPFAFFNLPLREITKAIHVFDITDLRSNNESYYSLIFFNSHLGIVPQIFFTFIFSAVH